MEMNGNEKTELKLQKKYTLSNNCNAYGPFFKQLVFLAAAFAFGCGFFLAAAFAFDCSLLRETLLNFEVVRSLAQNAWPHSGARVHADGWGSLLSGNRRLRACEMEGSRQTASGREGDGK